MASLSSNDAPKTTLREDLTALLQSPRELWLVYLATFLEYLGIFSFLQTLPLWLSSDFHMDDRRAGWWAATFSTLVTLFVFMVGTVADLVGVRRMLMISFSLAALTRLRALGRWWEEQVREPTTGCIVHPSIIRDDSLYEKVDRSH